MKIIVPMAGRGSRMRPHTLTVPKPLIPIAGKPIVQRLVESITAMSNDAVDEIAYIIGDFGEAVEKQLVEIAESLGAKGSIYHQTEALGTAHAILCAKESLSGNVIVAFADTLFTADFSIDTEQDGVIWVKQVADPSAFGVVKLGSDGAITDFIEKPQHFVSDMAIIGIYYFKDGEGLKNELQYLIDNDIRDKGEYQITNALENMKNKGLKLTPGTVDEWMDCGNKNATIGTNSRILELIEGKEPLRAATVKLDNATIIEPCYLGENVVVKDAVVGPHVSLGAGTVVERSVLSGCIVQNNTKVTNRVLHNSMLGNNVQFNGRPEEVSIGDFCTTE